MTSYAFSGIAADHTISASFTIDTYTITATAGAHGAINPTGAVVADFGSDRTITITPATGYHVADVTVDGVSVGAVTSYTFTNVAADHTLEASFAIDTHTLTATAGAHGAIDPVGATVKDHGTDQAYAITPDAHYHVADVLVDGVSVGAMTSYNFSGVAASHTIAASFAIDTYTITATAGAHGTASILPRCGGRRLRRRPDDHRHCRDRLSRRRRHR